MRLLLYAYISVCPEQLVQDRFTITTEFQQYVAGNTQRVAKLIAQQADFEV